MKALITRKLGMTSILDEKGAATPVTLLSASPNVVTQIKNADTDGYRALQLGFEANKRPAKPQAGHFKASNPPVGGSPKIVREFRIAEGDGLSLKVGDQLAADSFSVGDVVKVTGISKGKGFAGTIKRHNFHRGRKTHGGRSYRRPGSIGSMFPQRIFPGKKMAGQMGHTQITTRNLKIAIVDTDLNVIGVKGAVPGPRKGVVLLRGVEK